MNNIRKNSIIEKFVKSYEIYKGSFDTFQKLDKGTRQEITEHLNLTESTSSVEIEELVHAK